MVRNKGGDECRLSQGSTKSLKALRSRGRKIEVRSIKGGKGVFLRSAEEGIHGVHLVSARESRLDLSETL